uniref:Uncharacterized protein n=1 Tax=Sphaerodactylus townsendi TaxID=933632 RepID=A0ACB8G7N4_9SAUR
MIYQLQNTRGRCLTDFRCQMPWVGPTTRTQMHHLTLGEISLELSLGHPPVHTLARTPDNPARTPDNPARIPDNPVRTPDNPVRTPEHLARTPEHLVHTLEHPAGTLEHPAHILEHPDGQHFQHPVEGHPNHAHLTTLQGPFPLTHQECFLLPGNPRVVAVECNQTLPW